MKKILLALSVALTVAGCESGAGATATGIGKEMAKMWVDTQCRTELSNRNEWKLITTLMTAQQKTEWENKICGCASEEATQQLTAADMAEMMTTEGRAKVIGNVTVKTVSACVKRLYTDAVK